MPVFHSQWTPRCQGGCIFISLIVFEIYAKRELKPHVSTLLFIDSFHICAAYFSFASDLLISSPCPCALGAISCFLVVDISGQRQPSLVTTNTNFLIQQMFFSYCCNTILQTTEPHLKCSVQFHIDSFQRLLSYCDSWLSNLMCAKCYASYSKSGRDIPLHCNCWDQFWG